MSDQFRNDFARAIWTAGSIAGIIQAVLQLRHLTILTSVFGVLSIIALLALLLMPNQIRNIHSGFFAGLLIMMILCYVFIMFLNMSNRMGVGYMLSDILDWTRYFGLACAAVWIFSPKQSSA